MEWDVLVYLFIIGPVEYLSSQDQVLCSNQTFLSTSPIASFGDGNGNANANANEWTQSRSKSQVH